jgi:hypothetical protein
VDRDHMLIKRMSTDHPLRQSAFLVDLIPIAGL